MKKLFLFFLSIGISLQAVAGYVEGENAFNEQNYALAFDEFLPLAEEGDYRSQYYIGYLYVNGLGVQKDGKKGVEYLQKAVDNPWKKCYNRKNKKSRKKLCGLYFTMENI